MFKILYKQKPPYSLNIESTLSLLLYNLSKTLLQIHIKILKQLIHPYFFAASHLLFWLSLTTQVCKVLLRLEFFSFQKFYILKPISFRT